MMRRAWLTAAMLVLLCSPALAAFDGRPAPTWLGPDGAPLPFVDYDDAEQFLLRAEVVSRKRVGKGINNPWKVLLERDGVQAHAVFRDVDVSKGKASFRNGKQQQNFRDCAMFEVAAYRLARLLNLPDVPPTVGRKLFGQRGSLQLWIERAISEKSRIAAGTEPTNIRLWQIQMQHLRFFDNLIANSDRNQGNLLLDPSGRLWLIDHTRAFRRDWRLDSETSFYQMERTVWERLLNADRKVWEKELGDYLYSQEFTGLWKRRERVVERFQRLIAERGENLVLLEMEPAPTQMALR